MYTITQFRNHLREAFNNAAAGREVVIDRYGEKFILTSITSSVTYGEPHKLDINYRTAELLQKDPGFKMPEGTQ